jgi:ferredoxin
MKTALYYFSATGNTLVIARDLAQEMGGADIIPITKALKEGSGGAYEAVGIVFPVYMFGLPLIVADFVKRFDFPKDAYIFAVANFGGLPGRSLNMIEEMLARRGLKLAAGFGVLMPGNYTPLYEAISDEKQKSMFVEEKKKVKDIAAAVLGKRTGIERQEHPVINFVIYALLYRIGSREIPGSDAKLWVTDKCTGCRLCEKTCPVSNIVIKDGRPAWLHHCEHCMACLQWCPAEAIQYARSTVGRKRYHHPDLKAADIAAQR